MLRIFRFSFASLKWNPNQSNYNDATINRTCVVFKKLISLEYKMDV